MNEYIDAMQKTALSKFDVLFEGISRIKFLDFPDHKNVGDSAIALGQLKYLHDRNIEVEEVRCIGTYRDKVLESDAPVLINGGGNIAGLYEGIDVHRNRIGSRLRSDTLLIQGPQSIFFGSEESRKQFSADFGSRGNLRLAVRDAEAINTLQGIHENPLLVPDAVHLLGEINAPDPVQEILILKRRDRESATGFDGYPSLDWPADKARLRFLTSARWKAKYAGPFGEFLNLSPKLWERTAMARFTRGVNILSQGQLVITDRLHAMLISLQMGRPVIAVDNSNKKLTKYGDTWFPDARPNVRFASSFEEALDMAR